MLRDLCTYLNRCSQCRDENRERAKPHSGKLKAEAIDALRQIFPQWQQTVVGSLTNPKDKNQSDRSTLRFCSRTDATRCCLFRIAYCA